MALVLFYSHPKIDHLTHFFYFDCSLCFTHTSTLEGSRKKRKVQEEEAVHETTVSVHEEKKQKKMSESEEIIDPESEKNAIFFTKSKSK